MRKIFFVFSICLFTSHVNFGQDVVSSDEEIIKSNEITLNWMPNYKEALKKSKKEKKPVLIYFTGSDWCGPCKVLDKKLFHTEKFKALADKNLILLEVDIPRRLDIISPDKMVENKSIQKKYKVKAFPTLMFVNHRGKKIAEKKGYILSEYYYPFFQSEIDNY
ncbi:Thioredoxin-like [Polaribacter sp. KT25b]|uniref:thioredoxin family protein n=1 Tax=Polaribacter sp. KT25b TaxID=1855336 RepID=UPI00087DBDDB|nr:thioredoxin family protein [Polaribacter sp. KT25b]SDR77779.1 Thioredoxin-like [Polaribacter sp. KT25b]